MSGATPILLIVRELKTLANAHGQVKTFKYGQFLDVIKDTTIDYALCHANIRSANKNENSNVIQIELSLMDKTRGDDSNLFDVESNTYQIFIDLFNIISYSPRWQNLGVVNSSSAPQKFLNRGADVVTGWGAVIQFEIYEGLGFCDVPVYGYDYDAPIVPAEGPGKYQNSDLSFVQLIDPGDTFTAPDISFTDSDGTVIPKPANTDIIATPSANDIFLKGIFEASITDMPQLLIDTDTAGTFTSITDDGSSGTITLSINGGAYAVFSSPLVLVDSDTLDVKRTVSTATGNYKLTGTF